MSRIPNAVAFMFFLGLAVTVTSALTAPAATRVLALVAGVITSVIVALVVAGGVWLRTRLRRARAPKRGDGL